MPSTAPTPLHTLLTHGPLLLQAPMAGSQGSALALAVCQAGGIGALPAAMLAPEALAQELTRLSQGTDRPWNVNFFCHTPPAPDPARETRWRETLAPFYAEAGLDIDAVPAGAGRVPFSHAVADLVEPFRPPIVSFHFGLPAPDLLARVKGWGSVVLSSATTVEEALWLEAHGVDAVIAQGAEAGGHRGMFLTADDPHAPPLRGSLPPEGADPAWGGPAPDLLTSQMGTFALLPQIVAAVNVPVIAAGGIADAAGVRAALALGAAGVQVGTAYLCSDEALTSPIHRAALQSEAARHTQLTTLFSGRPARGIVNRLMRELGPLNPAAPAFPTATAAIAPLRAHGEKQGSGDFSPLWSGQNARGCRSVPAADITRELLQGFPAVARHVVIFRATARALDAEYSATAAQLRELALTRFGCLDFVAVTEGDQEVALSYWPDEASIRAWKQHADHLMAQQLGRERWYAGYSVEVAAITRHYHRPAPAQA